VSFDTLSQQCPEENLSIVMEDRVYSIPTGKWTVFENNFPQALSGDFSSAWDLSFSKTFEMRLSAGDALLVLFLFFGTNKSPWLFFLNQP
jgi:hypothetical protein